MKKFTFLLLLIITGLCHCQSSRWKDYFSYFNVKAIQQVDNLVFCASENGLFSYNKSTGELKKISKANGLHEVNISAFAYNSSNKTLLVGYNSGKLDILKQDKIHLVVDIPFDKNYQGNKKINHIYTEGNYAVLSMDFGITLFDLKKLEFKETCYFKQSLNYYKVNKSVILNNKIFAASTNGIYSHDIDNMLPNFSAWTHTNNGINFNQIAKNNSSLFISSNNTIYKSDDEGFTWQNKGNYIDLKDIVSIDGFLLLIQKNKIFLLDNFLKVLKSMEFSDDLNTGFYSDGIFYAGTQFKGLIRNNTYVVPDGPFNNRSYSLTICDNQLWVAPGGRNIDNYYQTNPNTYGFYHFNGQRWDHVSAESINDERYIMKVIPNCNNTREAFILSYENGLLKMVNNQLKLIYNRTNSPIIEYERLVGGDFDADGNLILIQTFAAESANGVNNAIIIKTPSDQFKFLSLLPKRINLTGGAMNPYIDSQGYIWVPSPRNNGLIVYKYNRTPLNTSDDKIYLIDSNKDSGNLPSNNILCVNLDKSGTAWIGTDSGLRILRNPYQSLETGNYNTERIVITQNGLGEEVLRETKITVIKTDAANRKWIGTHSSGVFYLSEDGTTLLNRFTEENSPLPSNLITDIQIDKTGEVYFVTPSGIVSYRSDIVDSDDEFGDIVAYPNPVRPGYTGNITIRGLAHDSFVKITDVAGNLVYETKAPGGVATWNGTNFNAKPVSSGVYLVLISNSEGKKHATTKIAIIR
jgi:ligand-binding sensor domain-containing protein